MKINKENYREFESDRFVFMSPAETTVQETPDTSVTAPEKTETKDKKEAKKKPEYVKNLVKTHTDSIHEELDGIETNYLPSRADSNLQKHEAAKKFISKMKSHSDATFKKITDEHARESMDVGEARKRATATANKINELIAGHKEHIEHIERVDTAESHEKTGEDAEKTEEKIAEEKADANTKTNKPKVEALNKYVKTLNTLRGVSIESKEPTPAELAQDELTLAPYTLTIDGKPFGSIIIKNPGDVDDKSKVNVIISIDNGSSFETNLAKLDGDLSETKLASLKENHEKAQKNKGEILGVLGEFNVAGIEIKKPDLKDVNLTGDKVDGIKGNITTADNTVIGTLILDVSYDGNGEPTYKYKVVDAKNVETPLDSIEEVNTHLSNEENQTTLVATAKETAKKKGNKESSEVLTTLEKPTSAGRLKVLIDSLKLSEFVLNKSDTVKNFNIDDITNENLDEEWEKIQGELVKVAGAPFVLNAMTKFFNGLSDSRISELESGDSKLSPAEDKQLSDMLMKSAQEEFKDIEEPDENEIKLAKGLTLTIKGRETTLGKEFGDYFFSSFSRLYKIEPSEIEGKIRIASAGTNEFEDVNAEELGERLGGSFKKNYLKIIRGESTPEELAKAKEQIEQENKQGELLITAFKDGNLEGVKNALTGGDPDKMKGFGLMDLIALFKLISEALQADPPDLSILADIGNDVSHDRSPLKMMKEAKGKFKDKLNVVTNAEELLAYCNDPGGNKANQEFGKIKYRSILKAEARKQLGEKLGITIDKYEQTGGGNTTKLTTTAADGKTNVILITKTTTSGLSIVRNIQGEKETDMTPVPGFPKTLMAGSNINQLSYAIKTADEQKGIPEPEATIADKGAGETAPKTEAEKKNAENAEKVKTALREVKDENMQTITENLVGEDSLTDLNKEKDSQITELKKDDKNVKMKNGEKYLNETGQKELDNWRREQIVQWVKDGKVDIKKVQDTGVTPIETETA